MKAKTFFIFEMLKGIFYTFTTQSGNEVSLTATHMIPIINGNKNIEIIRAENVQLTDRLMMFNETVEIKNISKTIKQGYYSPLTLTGYLLVNNISTSIYSDK